MGVCVFIYVFFSWCNIHQVILSFSTSTQSFRLSFLPRCLKNVVMNLLHLQKRLTSLQREEEEERSKNRWREQLYMFAMLYKL